MNRANVNALRDLLRRAPVTVEYPSLVAQYLATHGVLIPSALTPPDNWRLNKCAGCVGSHGAVISLEALAAMLERIAKGEPDGV